MEEVHFTEEYDTHGNLKITARLGHYSVQRAMSALDIRSLPNGGLTYDYVAHIRKEMAQQLRKCADDQLYWRGGFSVTLTPIGPPEGRYRNDWGNWGQTNITRKCNPPEPPPRDEEYEAFCEWDQEEDGDAGQ